MYKILKNIFSVKNEGETQYKVFTILGFKFKFKRHQYYRGRFYTFEVATHLNEKYIYKDYEGNDKISQLILKNEPAAIARFGHTELNIIKYFYNNLNSLIIKFPKKLQCEAKTCAGIFSPTDEILTRYSSEALDMCKNIDILSVWNYRKAPEYYNVKTDIIKKYTNPNIELIDTTAITKGMFYKNTWTKHLKGKKILVISPFEETVKHQYAIREKLFENNDILPEFELLTIKTPQGIGKNNLIDTYGNWFNAFNSICKQIDKLDFDIALISAGAYGMPLANYIKTRGRIGIHVAGALQLLFGIKGKRWENDPFFNKFYNEYWTNPFLNETPKETAEFIAAEGCAAYW